MAKQPDTKEFKQLPVYGVPPIDRVYLLEQTISSLEQAIFVDAAQLVDSMLRDDRITGVLTTRIHGLLGQPIELEPAKDTGAGRRVCEQVEDAWDDMFTYASLSELFRSGIMLGVGIGEIVWEKGEEWIPRLKVWHCQFLQWRWDTDSYWLTPAEGDVIEVKPGDGKWIVYEPYGPHGWLRGLVRALGRPWIDRNWAHRDWSRRNEVYGNAIRLAEVPQEASDVEKRRFEQQIANLGNESVIRLPINADKNNFGVRLLETTAKDFESFERQIALCDREIAVTILGQAMSTEGVGGLGSQAKAGESVRDDLKAMDAKTLAECIYRQFLPWYCFWNNIPKDLTPYPAWQIEPPEDEGAAALALKSLADSLASFKASGAPIDVRAILEAHNIPMISEAEQAQAEAEAAAKAQDMVSPSAQGSDTPPGAMNKPASDTANVQHGARRRIRNRGHIRGQFYADALVNKARLLAKKTLEPDLAAIKQTIAISQGYEDLRKRLEMRFRYMHPEALAKVVEKAGIMARLNGHASVLEDL